MVHEEGIELNEEYNEISQEADTGIVFDFNRLDHRTVTTTSLPDLYGVPVFSERFGNQVNQFNRTQEEITQDAFLRVLTGERKDDLEEIFLTVMRAEPELIIQASWEEPPPPESPMIMIGFAVIGMVSACFVWLMVEKVMKKRKKV